MHLCQFGSFSHQRQVPIHPKCRLRFIVYIFVIYDGTPGEFKTLVENFNSIDPDIELTLEHSPEQVSFLDTVVFRHGNQLYTKLYKKLTDTMNYLMAHSAHPPGCFKGFKSQAMRIHKKLHQTRRLRTPH